MRAGEGRETVSEDSDCGAGVQTGHACVVCWRGPADNAHLIDRSLVADPYHDPRRVVKLCREHHDAYDNHELDLLPYLEPGHRSELSRAVEIAGLMTTLERVTGKSWAPSYHGLSHA
jgi:hypothetical protein